MKINAVRFHPAGRADREGGLLGWATCEYAGLRLDGLAVRRTLNQRYVVSFPERRDSVGRSRAIVRPLDAKTHRAIEAQVIASVREQGHLS